MADIEKIEINKGPGFNLSTVTGTYEEFLDKFKILRVRIITIKGEEYIFRESQVVQRWINPLNTQKTLEDPHHNH